MEKELLKMAFNAGYDCSLMHNNGEAEGYLDFDEFYTEFNMRLKSELKIPFDVGQSEQLCEDPNCKKNTVKVIHGEPLRCSICEKKNPNLWKKN